MNRAGRNIQHKFLIVINIHIIDKKVSFIVTISSVIEM